MMSQDDMGEGTMQFVAMETLIIKELNSSYAQ